MTKSKPPQKKIRRHGEQTATVAPRPTKKEPVVLTPPKRKPAP